MAITAHEGDAAMEDALTHRADEEVVALAARGDDEALREVLRRYRPLVHAKGRTYFLAGGDRQDVIQEGMIGLYKAVRDYDRTRHPRFGHFADLCVTRQVITAVKSATRHKHTPLNRYVSLSGPPHGTATDEERQPEFLEQIADGTADPADRVTSAAELAQLTAFCTQVLSDLESEVLARYVDGETYGDIAAGLGRHTKAIDNAIQRIKRKLEAYVEARETVV